MAKFQRPAQSGTPSRSVLGSVYPYLLPLFLFLAITGISRQAVVGLVVVALVLSVGRTPWGNLRARGGWVTLAVVAYALVYLLSGLWCDFGAYAAQESTKMLAALAAFGLVLARTEEGRLRTLLWSLHGVVAAVSLLCIEASSSQLLTRGFSALMKLLGCSYPLETMGYEEGVRITGIFSNANVSAGLIAFGLVLGLYLYRTAGCGKERAAAAVTLGVDALAFFLSFSMGAMAAFALTCVVYLVCVGRGARLEAFVLMLECVLVTLVCSFGRLRLFGNGQRGAGAAGGGVRRPHLGAGPLRGPEAGAGHGGPEPGGGHCRRCIGRRGGALCGAGVQPHRRAAADRRRDGVPCRLP